MSDTSIPAGWAGGGFLRDVVVYARSPLAEGGRLLHLVGDVRGLLDVPWPELREDPGGWMQRIHPEDRPRAREAWDGCAPGHETSVDYRIVTPDGGARWLRDTFQRQDREGRAVLVGCLRDVSRERSLREQVEALEKRIWQAQRVDSLGTLAAGVAHDLNNLLTTILSSVDFLEEEPGLSKVARSDLRLIRKTARRGGEMVRKVLDFARRGESRGGDGRVDVARAVREIEPILRRSLGRQVELRCEVDDGVLPAHGDLPRIEQVLLNLVVNARDALMPDGGEIEVLVDTVRDVEDGGGPDAETGWTGEEWVRIRVRDGGPGIPEEDRRRIFEPFYTTKPEGEGGLGLSTVERIVRSLRGRVSVESEVGRGSTFTILLPPAEETGPLPDVAGPGPGETGVRVLVVAPDAPLRDGLTRTVGELGHRAVATERAGEALQLFDRIRPSFDFLVAGVDLPDRSGAELLQALRRRREGLPGVLVADEDARWPEAVPEDVVVLRAPFTAKELRAALGQAAVRAGGGERGASDGGTETSRAADGA